VEVCLERFLLLPRNHVEGPLELDDVKRRDGVYLHQVHEIGGYHEVRSSHAGVAVNDDLLLSGGLGQHEFHERCIILGPWGLEVVYWDSLHYESGIILYVFLFFEVDDDIDTLIPKEEKVFVKRLE